MLHKPLSLFANTNHRVLLERSPLITLTLCVTDVPVTRVCVDSDCTVISRERIERTPHEETTVTISGLQPGTTYLFRAVANVSNVLSASSKVLELTTESEVRIRVSAHVYEYNTDTHIPAYPSNLISRALISIR